MSASKMGAMVKYCGHDGCFVADIFLVEGANVVVANGPVTGNNLLRPANKHKPTHHLVDFPVAGYWGAGRGVFVVPQDQVIELEKQRGERMVVKMTRSVGKSTGPILGVKPMIKRGKDPEFDLDEAEQKVVDYLKTKFRVDTYWPRVARLVFDFFRKSPRGVLRQSNVIDMAGYMNCHTYHVSSVVTLMQDKCMGFLRAAEAKTDCWTRTTAKAHKKKAPK
jgi:hypothetical protein